MTAAKTEAKGFRFPMFEGLLPIKGSQVPTEIIAGITLAALAIPEVMGYTKISGTPVIDNWILKDKIREEDVLIGNLPEEDRKEVIDEAMHLARSPEAAGMPGYLGPG